VTVLLKDKIKTIDKQMERNAAIVVPWFVWHGWIYQCWEIYFDECVGKSDVFVENKPLQR
jgi:hypothetical protein